jgi:predicted phosphodiesterase
MDIAVISDLHLGARSAPNYFQHEDSEFLRFLDHLEANFERVVLLGDIWETLASRAPGDQLAELERARQAHPEIARRFAASPYTYVHGNHDLIAHSQGAPEQIRLDADGVRIVFTHGHQTDWLIEKFRWASEFGVWLGAWIRRAGLESLYGFFAWVDGWRAGAVIDPASCPFQRWAIEHASRCSADVVVTGHTHIATRAEHGERLFLNSGSCSEGQFSFLSLDTKRGNYGVHRSW